MCIRDSLQAVGRDARGRKQYRYHPDYVAMMDRRKFERLAHFHRALPGLRAAVAAELNQPLGSRRLAVATSAALIDRHLLRVGNEDSADDGHHGATTLMVDHLRNGAEDDNDGEEAGEDEHAGEPTAVARLDYYSKSGQRRRIKLDDDLARLLERFAAGSEDDRLLWFVDPDDPVRGDEPRHVSAAEVNEFVRLHTGPGFSTKDFRTWGGSAVALEARVTGADEVEAVDAAAAALEGALAAAQDFDAFDAAERDVRPVDRGHVRVVQPVAVEQHQHAALGVFAEAAQGDFRLDVVAGRAADLEAVERAEGVDQRGRAAGAEGLALQDGDVARHAAGFAPVAAGGHHDVLVRRRVPGSGGARAEASRRVGAAVLRGNPQHKLQKVRGGACA